ncbi:acetolactate synthase small subunit [Leucothrix pacifica]|uniref:Acetolactate synthase small subunit n=1 Tax=Leucothrix pacifica TaxID=1247513 RepID=A0A317CLC9_9GAMM|nr:acetolactate synthase small subunit [Leucothrix pacifica]PWQ99159.1 acetolactate synthase small subunit [Leucothrix pacifica]
MRHVISILMENESGALSRVVGLFSARGYNIESLSVAPTDDDSLSRLTLVTSGSEQIIEQIIKQLNKLIEIVKVSDLSDFKYIEREMMLLKVEAKHTDAITSIKQVADIFRGKIIDLSNKTFTIEVSGQGEKLDAFLEAMQDQIIIEVVRSGCIGIARGSNSLKI